MHGKKNLFIRNLNNSLGDLLFPITGKPALTCALVLVGVYASLDCPSFAPVLLASIAIIVKFIPKEVKWIVFLSLIAGFALFYGRLVDSPFSPMW